MSVEIDYSTNAEIMSNSSVVNMFFIDEIGEILQYGDEITPDFVMKLAALIEMCILSKEIVVRNCPIDIDDVYDSSFSKDIITKLSDYGAIVPTGYSASTVLDNEFATFSNDSREMYKAYYDLVREYDYPKKSAFPYKNWTECFEDNEYRLFEDEYLETNYDERAVFGFTTDDYIYVKERERADEIWEVLTRLHGIPYLNGSLQNTTKDAKSVTNISPYLYRRMEEYYQDYFDEVSPILGPTYVEIPSLLSLVLQEVKHIDELPQMIVELKDRFSNFVMETTELEYQLRSAKTRSERIKIVKTVNACSDAIRKRFKSQKTRISSRLFDITSKITPASMLAEGLSQVKDYNLEENGIIKIPGYYDLWTASEEIEDAMPLLKRVFGKQIDTSFMLKLRNINN